MQKRFVAAIEEWKVRRMETKRLAEMKQMFRCILCWVSNPYSFGWILRILPMRTDWRMVGKEMAQKAAAANKTRQDVERWCLSTANVWKRVGSLIKGYNQVEMMSYSPSICCLWFLICEYFFSSLSSSTAVKFDLSGNWPCLLIQKCKFVLKRRSGRKGFGVLIKHRYLS